MGTHIIGARKNGVNGARVGARKNGGNIARGYPSNLITFICLAFVLNYPQNDYLKLMGMD